MMGIPTGPTGSAVHAELVREQQTLDRRITNWARLAMSIRPADPDQPEATVFVPGPNALMICALQSDGPDGVSAQ